jgi:hypothetical protein
MLKYRIKLTQAEREQLLEWVKTGERKAKVIQQAQVLLGSDEATGRQHEGDLAQQYHLSVRSVERIRKQFFEQGMGMFDKKTRKTRSDKKIDGRVEAHLVALVCQGPPEGESKWKLQLLAERLVELQLVEHISSTMVGRLLKKMNLSLSAPAVG